RKTSDILTSAINDLLMTLGALLALCKSFSMQKSTVLCAIAAKRVKKQQTEKKIKKILVQKIGIPIMRLC
ncbi:hypothetical protein, partial [Klebsiella michiganensis]|uniref:hypothetical protein n=1 Tax=Klebsiella michiganensis TaxID=1134687 RepID=UPI001C6F4A61